MCVPVGGGVREREEERQIISKMSNMYSVLETDKFCGVELGWEEGQKLQAWNRGHVNILFYYYFLHSNDCINSFLEVAGPIAGELKRKPGSGGLSKDH